MNVLNSQDQNSNYPMEYDFTSDDEISIEPKFGK